MGKELLKEVASDSRFNELIWLRDFPEEYKDGFAKMLKENNIPNYTDLFDNWGLRFDLDHLNAMGLNLIHYPVEYMAEYVDVIMKNNIDSNNKEFIRVHFLDHEFNYVTEYNTWCATSIGNVAYCAINCKNEKAKEIAIKELQGCLHYYNQEVFPVLIEKLSNKNKA